MNNSKPVEYEGEAGKFAEVMMVEIPGCNNDEIARWFWDTPGVFISYMDTRVSNNEEIINMVLDYLGCVDIPKDYRLDYIKLKEMV